MNAHTSVSAVLAELPSAQRKKIAGHLLSFFQFVWPLREAEANGETNARVLEDLRAKWGEAFARLDRAVEDFIPSWELHDLLRKLSLFSRDELESELLNAMKGGGVHTTHSSK